MKLTKKIFTIVFMTFTCAFMYACEDQDCNIDKLDEVQKVEHTYVPFKEEELMGESLQGGAYTYYKDKENVIRKITVKLYGERGKTEITYYLLSEKRYKIQYKSFVYNNSIYEGDVEIASMTSGTVCICDNEEIVSAPHTEGINPFGNEDAALDVEYKVKIFKSLLKTVLDKINASKMKN